MQYVALSSGCALQVRRFLKLKEQQGCSKTRAVAAEVYAASRLEIESNLQRIRILILY